MRRLHAALGLFLALGLAAGAAASPIQAKALKSLPGASASLEQTLACLKGKKYPADIEQCGLSGFQSDAALAQAGKCLRTGRAHVNDMPVRKTGGYLDHKMAVVVCGRTRYLIELHRADAREPQFTVQTIAELLD